MIGACHVCCVHPLLHRAKKAERERDVTRQARKDTLELFQIMRAERNMARQELISVTRDLKSERARLDYMIQRVVEIHERLLDDPPMSEEAREKLRKLAEAIRPPGAELPPEPERVTSGIVHRERLLEWLGEEADAADLRCGFSPSKPGTALRTTANWIAIAYREFGE